MAVSGSLLGGHRDHPALGIATFVGNLLLMALLSAAVRELVNREYPLSEVLLFRYLFASLFFWLILFPTTGLSGLLTRRPLDHAIRSISGVVSLGLLYFAITRIPIADATALAYAAPIFITLMSIFLLGENIGLRRWLAVITGFIGVLLIARPEAEGFDIGVAAAATSAFTGALVAIWLRKLSSSENPVAIGIYYNNLGSLVCLVWVLMSGWLMPRGDDLLLFLGFGLGCGLQQWLLTVSFRYAEASLLAPFEYLAMVFAAIVGFVFWGEIPVLTTWLGAAVIAASGIFIFRRRQKSLQTDKTVEPVVIE
ncbi:MAG: DMT family transporter [Gammaproteobacteria bacterium]|nr:MAG: DMT family transporter [Gammaproteobacteria bacterium]UCH41475.1 MAG: DMT family transporter [Gammaproteobacteria bacterium]